MVKIKYFLLIILHFIVFSRILYAENSVFFNEKFSLSLFAKYNMGIFSDLITEEQNTDKPFNIGLGFKYNSFSAKISIPTYLTDPINIWAFDFELDTYFDKFFIEAYFKHYPYFYYKDTNEQSELDIHASGVMATFVDNYEKHSLASVITLDRMQTSSSGSLLYGFGIFHSSIYSEEETYLKFEKRQHMIYFGPAIGYSYTFIFKNDIFLNTGIMIYTNTGYNITSRNWIFVPQIEPKLILGYHQKTWSINLKMLDNAKFIIWNKNDMDILTLVSINIMFSKRF